MCPTEWQGLWFSRAAELGASTSSGGDGEDLQQPQRGEQDPGESLCHRKDPLILLALRMGQVYTFLFIKG